MMRSLALLFIVLPLCFCLTEHEKQILTDLHNNARADPHVTPITPLSPLTWDTALETKAQTWADNCRFAHSQDYAATLLGELVYRGGSGDINVTVAFNNWYKDGRYYDWTHNHCTFGTCIHYTQILWQKTTTFGCALSKTCDDGSQLLVCTYKNYGAYPGLPPFAFDPASVPVEHSANTRANAVGARHHGRHFNVSKLHHAGNHTRAPVAQKRSIEEAEIGVDISVNFNDKINFAGSEVKFWVDPTADLCHNIEVGTSRSFWMSGVTGAGLRLFTGVDCTQNYMEFWSHSVVNIQANLAGQVWSYQVLKPQTGVYGANAASWDWRDHSGVVTPIKQQGDCGSCWAVSATAVIEGAVGVKYGSTVNLASQQTLSCSNGGTCQGGLGSRAFNYYKTHGINTQDSYPYISGDGNFRQCAVKSQYYLGLNNGILASYGESQKNFQAFYDAMKTYGPGSVAVYAEGGWQNYRSGIYSKANSGHCDHEVVLVGYDSSKNAWIIKNQWGTSWGVSGYMYLNANQAQAGDVYSETGLGWTVAKAGGQGGTSNTGANNAANNGGNNLNGQNNGANNAGNNAGNNLNGQQNLNGGNNGGNNNNGPSSSSGGQSSWNNMNGQQNSNGQSSGASNFSPSSGSNGQSSWNNMNGQNNNGQQNSGGSSGQSSWNNNNNGQQNSGGSSGGWGGNGQNSGGSSGGWGGNGQNSGGSSGGWGGNGGSSGGWGGNGGNSGGWGGSGGSSGW